MKNGMKMLTLLLWVTQFGVSVLFPLCFFLLLGAWLQGRYGFGMWIMWVGGILGLLTAISATRFCLRALRREAEEAANRKEPPVSFNEHL